MTVIVSTPLFAEMRSLVTRMIEDPTEDEIAEDDFLEKVRTADRFELEMTLFLATGYMAGMAQLDDEGWAEYCAHMYRIENQVGND